MSKNVLLLALSTFPPHPDPEQKGIYTIEKENFFKYSEQGNADTVVSGFYQMEPIPNFLKQKGIFLNDVIMLSTSMTKKPVDVYIKDNPDTISPEEYFVSWIKNNITDAEGNSAKCHIIDLNEVEPSNAIAETVNCLNFANDDNVNLYVDTHGGFRNTQLILEAIIKLWQNEKINLEVFNVRHSSDEAGVIERDEAIRIFDFVSGINEFMNYGRIDSLLKFLSADENRVEINPDSDFLNPLIEISEGIQWCNINKFTNGLKHLKNYYKGKKYEISNPYLRIFSERIKDDFDKLLIDKYIDDAPTMVRWCMRKGFFQQALTLIESQMPLTLQKRGIIDITSEGRSYIGESAMNSYNGKITDMYNDCTYIYQDWLNCWAGNDKQKTGRRKFNEIFGDNYLENEKKIEKIIEIFDKKIMDDSYLKPIKESEICSPKNSGKSFNAISYNDRITGVNASLKLRKKIVVMIIMHRTLKDVRNKANHAADEISYTVKAIYNAIYFYLDLVDKISNELGKGFE